MVEPQSVSSGRVVVSVSLRQFYSDARGLVYGSVREGQRAGRLAARLARRWGLPGRVALVRGGHLLHPRHRLAPLAPGDVLVVIPQRDDWVLNEDDSSSSSEEEVPVRKRKLETERTIHDNNKCMTMTQNETLESSVMEDATSSEMNGAEDEDLVVVKRRALALLARCMHTPEPAPCNDEPDSAHSHALKHDEESEDVDTDTHNVDTSDRVDAHSHAASSRTHARRRRVRRRPRRPPADHAPPAMPTSPCAQAPHAHARPDDASLVLRNGGRRDTSARLVHPLL